jgi:hypothetical protein
MSMKNAAPKLSNTSKMPGKSWSLPAWETCPGARDDNGSPVDACSMCYALTGAYNFPGTIAAREHNLADWKRHDWVDAMVKAIGKAKYFRWFDSGDVYHSHLATKIEKVIRATPNCQHWLPTRSYKNAAIHQALESIAKLNNAVVRYSSDSREGERLDFGLNSTIIQNKNDFIPEKSYALCLSGERGGKCGSCRACWSKAISTIAYIHHGNKVSPKKFEKSLISV